MEEVNTARKEKFDLSIVLKELLGDQTLTVSMNGLIDAMQRLSLKKNEAEFLRQGTQINANLIEFDEDIALINDELLFLKQLAKVIDPYQTLIK